MGYNLHVTRRLSWLDEGDDISFEEWRNYLDISPDMRLDGYAEAVTASGAILRVEDETMAVVWTGYSKNGMDGNWAWLWLSDGMVVAKNPDAEIRRKMFAIAQHFGGRVIGETDEAYGEDGEPVAVADHGGPASGTAPPSSKERKPWWKCW